MVRPSAPRRTRSVIVAGVLTLILAVVPPTQATASDTEVQSGSAAAPRPTGIVTGLAVTDYGGGDTVAVADAPVSLVKAGGTSVDDVSGPGSGQTDGRGRFTFEHVPPGQYRVMVTRVRSLQQRMSLYLGNTPFEREARVVTVGSGTVAVGQVAFPPAGGTLSGRIHSPHPASLRVDLYLVDPVTGVFTPAEASSTIDDDGFYAFSDLPTGDHVLEVVDPTSPVGTRHTFWPGVSSARDAGLIAMRAGGDVRLDVDAPAGGTTVQRLGGVDRYATAAAISRRAFPRGATTVYIANGTGFADALSAGPAAIAADAPVLLTATGALPAVIAAELGRLRPGRIVIVGGTGSVSMAVEKRLRAYSPSVRRVAGADRYATSRAIARDSFGRSGAKTVVVATGADYPDALSAGAVSGPVGAPVILVPGTSSAPDAATTTLLSGLGATGVWIAGGEGAVSASLDLRLLALPTIDYVRRLAGPDRYATSMSATLTAAPFSDTVYLASGAGFADAVAGAAAAGAARAPVLLVRADCIPSDTLDEIEDRGVNTVVLLGGSGVLGRGVEQLRRC